MLNKKNTLLSQVINEYSRLENSFQYRKKWNDMLEDQLWGELCLCILSSNVPYELAKSAFFHLRVTRLLKVKWIISDPSSPQQIAYELSKRIYLPKRKDGSYRKYRFPNIRAKNIVSAAKTIYLNNSGLLQYLKKSKSEQEARDFLAKNVAGVGLKEASHFLRNVGYSNSLAIIDSHIVTFLKETELIPQERIKTITHKIYMKMERILQNLCSSMDLNLSIFDMAIWQCMRGK